MCVNESLGLLFPDATLLRQKKHFGTKEFTVSSTNLSSLELCF